MSLQSSIIQSLAYTTSVEKMLVQKPIHLKHGVKTPSYNHTQIGQDIRIHFSCPCDLNIFSPRSPMLKPRQHQQLDICHRTPHTSSKAEHIFAQVNAADKG